MRLEEIYATADEAKRASKPKQKIRTGWQREPARIKEAHERTDKNGEDMIELLLGLRLPDGGEFERRDWLSNKWGAEKLRNCCIACDLLDYYEQQDIPASLFPGKDVMVKLVRSGKYLNVEDYRRVSPVVTNFRNAAKALLLLGGVSLAALGGCASGVDPFNAYPHGQSSSYVEPQRYQYYEQRFVDPPANYAATVPQAAPVASPSPSWQHEFGTMANGAAIGAAGGMVAGRALERREAAQAGRALAGDAAGAVTRGAERAAVGVAERAAVGAAERAVVGRAAGAAAVAAGVVEAEIFLDGLWLLLLF